MRNNHNRAPETGGFAFATPFLGGDKFLARAFFIFAQRRHFLPIESEALMKRIRVEKKIASCVVARNEIAKQ
jgi:hypothetical protein